MPLNIIQDELSIITEAKEKQKRNLYGFMSDPSLWIFIAVAIILLIRRWASGVEMENYLMFGIMISVGLATIFIIIADRNSMGYSRLIIRYDTFKFKLVLTAINLGLVIIPSVFMLILKRTTWTIIEQVLLVGVWEQLIFAVTIPYFITRVFTLIVDAINKKRSEKKKLPKLFFPVFSIAVAISSVAFGFMHVYAYNFEYLKIWMLILIGFPMHYVGYLLPSASITAHFLINFFILSMNLV